MIYKSTVQPLCRCCGNAIGKRTETHWICAENPEQRGSIATNPLYHYIKPGEHWPTNVEEVQQRGNLKVVSVRRASWSKDKDRRKQVASFTVWDGKSYDDEFFCKGACAQDFGRMAAKSGKVASVAYNDAIKRQKGESVS